MDEYDSRMVTFDVEATPILPSSVRSSRQSRRQQAHVQPLPGIVGDSPAMREVVQLTRLVAPSKAGVLIVGETGTGKELIARALFQLSQRAKGPYIRVNCGALHENLLESELFGHVKGSFTGAIENKTGRFEAADGGTIFLDEINSTSTALQVKLLRVIQDGLLERVGDGRSIKVDVRIIAASNELLHEKVAAGRFREDLYYRLNVVPIYLPPLRSRREDIVPLARLFLDRFSRDNGIDAPELTPRFLQMLEKRDWPGNVRELENTIERFVLLSRSLTSPDQLFQLDRPRFPFRGQPEAGAEDLQSLLQRAVKLAVESEEKPGALYDNFVRSAERELLSYVLSICDGVQTKAAAILGINRNSLHKKIGDSAADENNPDWVI
jgi:transcriptional regulator with GAF, ATPase, and Fis domain